MKIYTDHFYGSEEKIDLQVIRLTLDLENSKEVEALEKGWSLNKDVWYNSRSTRLNTSAYSSTKIINGYNVEYTKNITDLQYKQINEIYDQFIKMKNFNKLYELLPNHKRTSWLLVSSDNNIHAFTMFTQYDGALESNLSAWDYSEPKKSIGKKLIDFEIDIAKKMGYQHLYIGSGYNQSSIYKSNLKGFEWWTGNEWSNDKDKYNELCYRDSSIKTLEELSKIYVDGFPKII